MMDLSIDVEQPHWSPPLQTYHLKLPKQLPYTQILQKDLQQVSQKLFDYAIVLSNLFNIKHGNIIYVYIRFVLVAVCAQK